MSQTRFPRIETDAIRDTRDALHAASRVVGAWAATARDRRKHWWHASLRPTVSGVGTGVIRAETDFDLEVDFVRSALVIRTAGGESRQALSGQSGAALAGWLDDTLGELGVDAKHRPGDKVRGEASFPDYAPDQARHLHEAFASVAASMETFRAGIREETSPIQIWPHHFDLSMIWLPGHKIADQDPANEEYADKQMNFGFVLGDEGITDPYLYVTAYPLPEALPSVALPAGAEWRSDGFSGVVVMYRDLAAMVDAGDFLHTLWRNLYRGGQQHLAVND